MRMAVNPVLGRELKERFRSRRAPVFVTLWVLGVGLVGYLVYLVAQVAARDAFGLGQGIAAGYMGQFIFEAMMLLLMTGVVMIVPGLTALSIVGERERQTFHLLQVTQLTPLQIVLGKLWSSMSYFLLLVVAVAPIVGLPLLFGGVGLVDVVVGFAMLMLTAVMLGSVGIWGSSRARSARGAVANAYLWAFVVAFITIALLGAELLFTGNRADPFPARGREVVSILPNPYVGMVSAVAAPLGSDGLEGTPFDVVEVLLYQRQGFDGLSSTQIGRNVGVNEPFADDDPVPGAQDRLLPTRRLAVWVYTVGLYAAVIAVSLAGATRRVAAPTGRIRTARRSRDGSS